MLCFAVMVLLSVGMLVVVGGILQVYWALSGDRTPHQMSRAAWRRGVETELTRLLAKDMPLDEARARARRQMASVR